MANEENANYAVEKFQWISTLLFSELTENGKTHLKQINTESESWKTYTHTQHEQSFYYKLCCRVRGSWRATRWKVNSPEKTTTRSWAPLELWWEGSSYRSVGSDMSHRSQVKLQCKVLINAVSFQEMRSRSNASLSPPYRATATTA